MAEGQAKDTHRSTQPKQDTHIHLHESSDHAQHPRAGFGLVRLADEARWLELQLGLTVSEANPIDPPAGAGNFGYNAASGDYGDMVELGILDPTKVTRTALQNAASIAGLMITTEAMVAEAPKKDEPAMPAGGGMGGMGGMDF